MGPQALALPASSLDTTSAPELLAHALLLVGWEYRVTTHLAWCCCPAAHFPPACGLLTSVEKDLCGHGGPTWVTWATVPHSASASHSQVLGPGVAIGVRGILPFRALSLPLSLASIHSVLPITRQHVGFLIDTVDLIFY